jgi:divalent metal cation (Fe/Co/Zn/Cd) transporter
MFQSDNAILMAITIVLAVAGTVLAVLLIREVIEIGRSVYKSIVDDMRYSHSSIASSESRVTPFRDRKTVERVIDYFEDEDKQPG